MKKIFAVILGFLVLAGCDKPKDGYKFEGKEWELTHADVEIFIHPSVADLRSKGPKIEGRDIMAWSELTGKNKCTIHIVDPDVYYTPEWIGHELAHCFWGRWHKQETIK